MLRRDFSGEHALHEHDIGVGHELNAADAQGQWHDPPQPWKPFHPPAPRPEQLPDEPRANQQRNALADQCAGHAARGLTAQP